jgi:hypothetical protein
VIEKQDIRGKQPKKPEGEQPVAAPPLETLYRITRKSGGLCVEEVQAAAYGTPKLIGHDIFDIAIAKLHAAIRKRVGL